MSPEVDRQRQDRKEKLLGVVFLSGVTVTAALFGFSYSVAAAKKQEPNHFTRGLTSGAALGTRALAYGTLLSVSGVGLLTVGVCALLGVHSPVEFRLRMQSLLKGSVPDIPRSQTPGRSDFATIRELFEYLSAAGSESNPEPASPDRAPVP